MWQRFFILLVCVGGERLHFVNVLTFSQILFLSGLAFVIGLERTFRFFFQWHKVNMHLIVYRYKSINTFYNLYK